MKEKKLKEAKTYFTELKKLSPSYLKNDYYSGLISFRTGDYEEATRSFEKYLTNVPTKDYYDTEELSFLVQDYSEALYQLDDQSRFQRVAEALISDLNTRDQKNPFMKSAIERVQYLLIESLASTGSNQDYVRLEPIALQFKEKFPRGKLIGRVNYLLGLSYVKRDLNDKGRVIFEARSRKQRYEFKC